MLTWANHFTSLGLGFLICKIGLVIPINLMGLLGSLNKITGGEWELCASVQW